MAAIVYANIYAEVRDIITGDASATTPTDGQLSRKAQEVVRDLLATYTCLGDGAGALSDDLGAAEVASFERAVGYRVAAKLLETPAGQSYGQAMLEVRIGPVTRKTGGMTLSQLVEGFDRSAADELRRIGCIAAAFPRVRTAALRSGQWVSREAAGRRDPENVIEAAFGPGEESQDEPQEDS